VKLKLTLYAKMNQLHVLARSCRGHARDRFQEEIYWMVLGKALQGQDSPGGRELLWVCLISAIQPEIVIGGL
jgi:hypothetical protein